MCMCLLMPPHTWNLGSSYTRVSYGSPVWSSVCERLLQASKISVGTCHKICCQQAEAWRPSCGCRDRPGWGQHSPPHHPHPPSHHISPRTGCERTRPGGGPPSQSQAEGAAYPHYWCHCCSRETANQMSMYIFSWRKHTSHANYLYKTCARSSNPMQAQKQTLQGPK